MRLGLVVSLMLVSGCATTTATFSSQEQQLGALQQAQDDLAAQQAEQAAQLSVQTQQLQQMQLLQMQTQQQIQLATPP